MFLARVVRHELVTSALNAWPNESDCYIFLSVLVCGCLSVGGAGAATSSKQDSARETPDDAARNAVHCSHAESQSAGETTA